jgi:hypothetical protein
VQYIEYYGVYQLKLKMISISEASDTSSLDDAFVPVKRSDVTTVYVLPTGMIMAWSRCSTASAMCCDVLAWDPDLCR